MTVKGDISGLAALNIPRVLFCVVNVTSQQIRHAKNTDYVQTSSIFDCVYLSDSVIRCSKNSFDVLMCCVKRGLGRRVPYLVASLKTRKATADSFTLSAYAFGITCAVAN